MTSEVSKGGMKRLEAERKNLLTRIKALEKDKAKLLSQLNSSKATIERLMNEKQKLAKHVEELEKGAPKVGVEEVAGSLKNALQVLQRELRRPKGPGEMEYFVDKFEVEIKSGLDLKSGVKLVQPAPAELKPESLSTVRISFRPKPKLKIAEE